MILAVLEKEQDLGLAPKMYSKCNRRISVDDPG
jgi:hypothetical protein